MLQVEPTGFADGLLYEEVRKGRYLGFWCEEPEELKWWWETSGRHMSTSPILSTHLSLAPTPYRFFCLSQLFTACSLTSFIFNFSTVQLFLWCSICYLVNFPFIFNLLLIKKKQATQTLQELNLIWWRLWPSTQSSYCLLFFIYFIVKPKDLWTVY